MQQHGTWRRWVLGAGLAAIVAGIGLILVAAITRGFGTANAVSSIIGTFVSLLGVAASMVSKLWPDTPGVTEARTQTEAAVEQLTDSVKAISNREEEQRRIGDPRPLPVTWHTAADAILDHWPNIHRTPEHTHALPLAGNFLNIRAIYQEIPSRRLVILGAAGAGKTVLAHRLLLDLLDHHLPTDPVPVLFSLGNWNPNTAGLRPWLANQLERDYPYLDTTTPTGSKLTRSLVENDFILPILDGFDEIPHHYHHDAIDEISRYQGPLIVTSRKSEYTTAIDNAKALSKAAAIELDDLPLDEAHKYLRASSGKTRASQWDALFDHLRTKPHDPASHVLATVLNTPLMVMLARTIYSDTHERNPRELLDPDRFPTLNALEEHLLSVYLKTVYDPRRTDSGSLTYHPDEARRWLADLAHHLSQRNTHDLSWWQLPTTLPWYTRLIATTTLPLLTAGLVVGLAEGLAYGFTAGLADALAYGPIFWFLFGFLLGLVNEARFLLGSGIREPERLRLRLRRRRQRHGKTPRAMSTRISSIATDFTTGIAVGIAAGLTFGLTFGLRDALSFALEGGLSIGITAGLPPEITTGFTFALTNGLTDKLTEGLAAGFAFGLVVGFGNIFLSALTDSQDPRETITPWQLLTKDRTVALIQSIPIALTFGILFGLTSGLTPGLTFGLTTGLARLSLSAWGNWVLYARLWLPLTRQLPWRPTRFIDDAYHRGVLRQTGASYQLRHARLRDHLTHHYQLNRNQRQTHRPAPR